MVKPKPNPFRRYIAALFALCPLAANGRNPHEPGFPAGIRIPENARGEAAITALGARLPEVAAFYGKSPQQLREVFRADNSLWVNPEGLLLYACELGCADCGHAKTAETAEAAEAEVIAESIAPTDPSPYDTSQAFLLHSRPGANRVIHLDFDGHTDNTPGFWKDGASAPVYNISGDDPTVFSTEERNNIIEIWQRVAEDYAMFDIDVTTEEPNIEALRKTSSGDAQFGMRCVIGGSGSTWFGNNVGGVALSGTFDANQDVPCWVFPVGGTGFGAKNVAEAASHEVGHTLGLAHDGIKGGSGASTGQGNWAPIMGVGYYEPITHWSKGEYASPNNTEDDLAVMLTQGAVYRPDDHGGTVATATLLSTNSSAATVTGVIERNTDLDFFRIDAVSGSLVIHIKPTPLGANLRLEVKLYDSGGVLLQTATAADVSGATSGGTRPVTLTRTVSAGVFYVSVDGIGNGDVLTTGYTDYSSLGQYTGTITGVDPGGFTWLPVAAGTQQWNNTANWAPNTIPNAAGAFLRVNNNIAGDQTIQLASATTLGTLVLGDANSTHGFTLASSGGSIIFNNSGNPAELSKTTGSNDLISAPLVLAGALDITQSASGNLSFSGGISGSGALTKAGTGTVVFSSANSYTGTTNISAGTLAIGSLDALGGTSGITISGGATLQPDVVDAVISAPITVGNTGTTATITAPSINSGTNLLTLGGAISGNGNVTFKSIQNSNAAGTILLNGAGTYAGSTLMTTGSTNTRLYVKLGTTNALPITTVLTIDGGNGTGSGRECELDLNGKNQTLAGLTSVVRSLRTHRVVNNSATPATLTINNSANHTFPEALGDAAGSNFGLTKSGSGTFTLSGSSTYTGATLISGGKLQVGNLSALGNTSGITISGGATFVPDLDGLTLSVPLTLGSTGTNATINAPISGSAPADVEMLTLSGVISGAGDLTLNGSEGTNTYGTIVLGAANDYSGATRIDCSEGGATCFVNNGTANALPVTTVLTLDGGPGAGTGRTLRYDLKGFDQTLAGLTNITGLALRRQQVDNTGAPATLTLNHTADYTFGGSVGSTNARIQGAISLVKSGGGRFTLVETHTYTGDTTVNEGILSLDDINPSNDSSTVTIAASGATIDLDFPGTDTVDKLFIGATPMAAGEYKAVGSAASGTGLAQLTGTGTLTVTSGPPAGGYSSWASANAPNTGNDPNADEDGDGVVNGVEYILGGLIGTRDLDKLPGISTSGGNMLFTFKRDQKSIHASTNLEIQVSPDLTGWTINYPVPDGAAANSPGVSVVKDTPSGFDTVTLALPLSDLKKFARLKVTP